jgi:hypothetical protein
MTQPPEWTPPSGWTSPEPAPAGEPDFSGNWETLDTGPASAPRPVRRGRLVAAAVAVVVAAGGVVSYVALSDSSHHGAATPRGAVEAIVTDINNSDLLGVLNDLAPGERAALVDPVTQLINELKKAQILSADANPANVAGVQFRLSNLAFAANPVTINNHVAIVPITDGSLFESADLAKAPLAKAFVDALFPSGLPAGSHSSQTIDIAQQVAANGGPVRIATEKVDGRWYPSIFYTAADSAAHKQPPDSTQAIAPRGGSSPADAVSQLVHALVGGDIHRAIELADPNELAVLHDYAGTILAGIPSEFHAPFTVNDLEFNPPTSISNGEQRITLKKVSVTTASGRSISVTLDSPGCTTVVSDGKTQHECAADAIARLKTLAKTLAHIDITAGEQKAITDLLTGASGLGIDTDQVDGQYYVSGVRTYFDLIAGALSGLQPGDGVQLVKLVQAAADAFGSLLGGSESSSSGGVIYGGSDGGTFGPLPPGFPTDLPSGFLTSLPTGGIGEVPSDSATSSASGH